MSRATHDTWNARISHISAAQSLYIQHLNLNFSGRFEPSKKKHTNTMETSIFHPNKTTQAFCSSYLLKKTRPCSYFSVSFPNLIFKTRRNPTQGLFLSTPNLRQGLVMECAIWGKDLEAEEDWIDEMGGGLREKCKEREGLVEILECLEREAIMGDDEGREAVDYNRRALIFDKSSQVFTALKQQQHSAANPSSAQS